MTRRDDRETAQIWATMIHIAMQSCLRTSYRGFDLDLAFVVNEANIMRCMLLIACKQADIDIEELRSAVQPVVEKDITKLARKAFSEKRKQLATLE